MPWIVQSKWALLLASACSCSRAIFAKWCVAYQEDGGGGGWSHGWSPSSVSSSWPPVAMQIRTTNEGRQDRQGKSTSRLGAKNGERGSLHRRVICEARSCTPFTRISSDDRIFISWGNLKIFCVAIRPRGSETEWKQHFDHPPTTNPHQRKVCGVGLRPN